MQRITPKAGAVSGTWVALGNEEYLVPPLNFKALREFTPKLDKMNLTPGSIPSGEDIGTMVDISHAAISRNYPDLPKEKLEEVIDMANFIPMFQAVIKVSGLEPVPGEVPAANP